MDLQLSMYLPMAKALWLTMDLWQSSINTRRVISMFGPVWRTGAHLARGSSWQVHRPSLTKDIHSVIERLSQTRIRGMLYIVVSMRKLQQIRTLPRYFRPVTLFYSSQIKQQLLFDLGLRSEKSAFVPNHITPFILQRVSNDSSQQKKCEINDASPILY